MKKVAVVVSGVALAAMIFSGVALAAEKFGYVSIEKIGDSYLKAKEYMKVIDEREKVYSDEVNKKSEEMKAYQDKYNLLSEKEKQAKGAEMESKIKAFQEFVRQKQSDLRKEEFDKTMELSKEIKEAIEKYSVKEGYTFIFDAAALAYKPQNMDISDKVIDILNKGYKK